MNKKGFTILELLSVVIVLAILSLVTTAVATVIIETADKEAAKNSARGYVEALNMEIMEGNYSSKKLIKSGYYYAQYFENELGFSTGGALPKEDSWVYIKDGEVKKYSLKFKKYSATKLEEDVVVGKTISEHNICFKLDVKYKGAYNYGDSYSCYVGDGKVRIFYLLEDGDSEESTGKTPKEKITLIMKNNLTKNYNEKEIEELTKDWINVDIPTKEQIEKSTKQDFLRLEENYIVSNGSSNTVMTKDGFDDSETNYGYRPVIVVDKDGDTPIDTDKPISSTFTYTRTSKSITVIASGKDKTSKIVEYAFSKDNGTTWTPKQTSNKYVFDNLTTGTYKVKVRVYDQAGNYLDSAAQSIETVTITTPTYSVSPSSGWAISKTVTIKYPSGYTKEYSLDGGTTWHSYTKPIVLTDLGATRATVLARVTDGKNYVTASSQTVTEIYLTTAQNVSFTPDDASWNVDNVYEALEDLRNRLNN